ESKRHQRAERRQNTTASSAERKTMWRARLRPERTSTPPRDSPQTTTADAPVRLTIRSMGRASSAPESLKIEARSSELWHNPRRPVLAPTVVVCGRAVLAREFFRRPVEHERRSERGRRFFEIDLVRRQILETAPERLGQPRGLQLLPDFARLLLAASEMG